jgi:hypothetical protein
MTYEPDLPNLRQVHLMHEELLDELTLKGFKVCAGQRVMTVVRRGGTVRPDDSIRVEPPPVLH